MDLRRDDFEAINRCARSPATSLIRRIYEIRPSPLRLRYRGQSRHFSIFGFENENGQMRYYDEAGGSVERSLLSTPLRFVRISSAFSSKRRHLNPWLHEST